MNQLFAQFESSRPVINWNISLSDSKSTDQPRAFIWRIEECCSLCFSPLDQFVSLLLRKEPNMLGSYEDNGRIIGNWLIIQFLDIREMHGQSKLLKLTCDFATFWNEMTIIGFF